MSATAQNPDYQWLPEQRTLLLPAQLTLDKLDAWLTRNGLLKLPVETVDFAQNQTLDSALLALMVHWSLQAKRPIRLLNPTAQFMTLMTLYDLHELMQPVPSDLS
ncbi:MAG: hypothetical protein JXR44_06455 [Thiotrichales bacterium]|nr:hypothetical protein [Thiotrichales bacterium]